MADEIPLIIEVDASQGERDINSFAKTFTDGLAKAEASAKTVTGVLKEVAEGIKKAQAAQEEYNAAVAAGNKNAVAPKMATNAAPVAAPSGKKFTTGGDLLRGAAESAKGNLLQEDYEKIGAKIGDNFTKGISGKLDLSAVGEKSVKVFEKLGGTVEHFAKALEGGSITEAAAGIQSLASGAATAATALGATGTALGAVAIGVAAVTAVIAGAVAAVGGLAIYAANTVVAMDDLGKSAGTNAEGAFRLKNAFEMLGSSGEKMGTTIRMINMRMLTDWPAVEREVRDSSRNIADHIESIAAAYRGLQKAQNEATLAPINIRDAERNVADAARAMPQADLAKQKASLSVQDALDGQVRAQLNLNEAERASAASSRNTINAQLDLNQALVQQREAVFAVANSYRAVKQAQLSVAGGALGIKQDTLSIQQLEYKWRLLNGGRRNEKQEKQMEKDSLRMQIQAAYQKRESDILQQQVNLENLKRRRIEKEYAGDAQTRADNGVAAAREGVQKAYDDEIKSAMDLAAANRGIITANIATQEAQFNLAKATQEVAAKMDGYSRSLAGLGNARQENDPKVVQEQIDSLGRKVEAQKAQLDDYLAKDPKVVRDALAATPAQRKNNPDSYVQLDKVSVDTLGKAISLYASPDGGDTAPSPMQVLEKISNLLFNNPNDKSLRVGIGKIIAARGQNPEEVLRVLSQGWDKIEELMKEPKKGEVEPYQEPGVIQSRAFLANLSRAVSKGESIGVNAGMAAMPAANSVLEGLISGADAFPELASEVVGATTELGAFTAALVKATTGVNGIGANPVTRYMNEYMSAKDNYKELNDNSPWVKTIKEFFGGADPSSTSGPATGKQSNAGFLIGSAQASESTSGKLMEGNGASAPEDMSIKTMPLPPPVPPPLPGKQEASPIVDALKKVGDVIAGAVATLPSVAAGIQAKTVADQGQVRAQSMAPGASGRFNPDNDPRYKNIPPRFRRNHVFPPPAGASAIANQAAMDQVANGTFDAARDPRMENVPERFRANTRFPPDVDNPATMSGPANPWKAGFAKLHPELTGRSLNKAFRVYESKRTAMSGADAYGNHWVDAKTGKRMKVWDGDVPAKGTGGKDRYGHKWYDADENSPTYGKQFDFDTGEQIGKAAGGPVRGPGSGTSDSIPANLSNGEYVIRANAVSHWGVGMMDAINNFASGGLVMPSMMPSTGTSRMSRGSLNQYSLDIRTNEGSFTAMVNGDTMNAIRKSAMGAKMKSSGVKPSWYGK